jgi:aspartate carbamoyltransferase catalytic subunit
MPLTHVIESQQFTLPLLQQLFQRSRGMERVVARGGTQEFRDRIMATLFYQPSTRTRLSFEAAMHRLGGRVLSTEQARAFSSEVAGEQLEDTIRTIGGIADTIVLRHTEQDGAARAATVSPVPIINAGDGNGGQHPTQALLDLYTIWRDRGSLEGLSIAMVGELDRGRTVRSLSYLLSKFDRVKIHFVSPPEVQMQPDILEHLDRHGTWYELQPDLARVITEVDVLYLTRIKPDRVRERASLTAYTVDPQTVCRMKPDALILHPLPRTVELDPAVDRDPRARYFQQATNGLFVRMALLTMLFDEP